MTIDVDEKKNLKCELRVCRGRLCRQQLTPHALLFIQATALLQLLSLSLQIDLCIIVLYLVFAKRSISWLLYDCPSAAAAPYSHYNSN